MSAEINSVDISQIKRFALAIESCEGRQQTYETDTLHTDTNNASTRIPFNYSGAASEQHILVSVPSSATKPRSVVRGQDLPSTIPESVKQKMQSSISQSPNDTQPASQWVYDDLTRINSIYRDDSVVDGADSVPLKKDAVRTLKLHGSQPLPLDAQDEDEEDILSQDIRAEPFPESKRFHVPKTPASQSRKRKRHSPNNNTQELQASSLPFNPFASRGSGQAFMGPSQLFQVTQAQTSPPVAHSDGLSDRPSPDLHNLQRPYTVGDLASPVPLPTSNMARAVTEPHTNYVSMKESQEARERARRLQELELSPDELSDNGFGELDIAIQRKLERRHLDQVSKRQLAGSTSRTQPIDSKNLRRQRSGRVVEKTHSSPIRPTRQVSDTVLISDDPPQEGLQGSITEEETDREDEADKKMVESLNDTTEENKENIEVPMTGSRRGRVVETNITQSSPIVPPAHRGARVIRASEPSVMASSASMRPSPAKGPNSASSSQAYAVVDSQASQHLKTKIGAQPSKASHSQQQGPASSDGSRAVVLQSQISQGAKDFTPQVTPDQGAVIDDVEPFPARQPEPHSNTVETAMKTNLDRPLEHHINATRSAMLHIPTHRSNQSSSQASRSERQVTTELDSSKRQLNLEQQQQFADPPTNDHPPTIIPSPQSTPMSITDSARKRSAVDPRDPSTYYETAREQTTETPSRSRIRTLGTDEGATNASTTRPSPHRIPSIGDILAHSSVSDNLGTDELNFNLIDSGDQEFLNAISVSNSKKVIPRIPRSTKKPSLQTRTPWNPAPRCNNGLHGTPSSPPRSAYSILTPPGGSSQPEDAPSFTANKDHGAGRSPSQSQPKDIPNSSASVDKGAASTRTGPVLRALGPSAAAERSEPLIQETPAVIAPHRVFAHFNGHQFTFSPATCIGTLHGGDLQYEVIFDDGNKATVSSYGIKRLECRTGDVCKVDVNGLRFKNYIVQGMRGSATADEQEPLAPGIRASTDVFGNTYVALKAKSRKSLNPGEQDDDNYELVIPIRHIYFTQIMWAHIKDRDYAPAVAAQPGLQTPSERPSTPSSPSSRAHGHRRGTVEPVASTAPLSSSNDTLFQYMAFTLTNFAVKTEQKQTYDAIQGHGGRILESGFDELFQVPVLSRVNSPSKHKPTTFRLKPLAEKIHFTCLIADRHCRRAKYIQALALGIPCIATRWIHDCIAQGSVLALSPYVLPAGESSFLNGAIRSRVYRDIPDPSTWTLSTIFDARPRMLNGAAVLLIMSKDEESKMGHHNFLTHALGAGRVAKVSSIDAAAKVFREGAAGWDYVFTYDREKEAEKALYGGSRRRKKFGGEAATGKLPKVTGNEYVIQSLILGQLLDA